MLPLRIIGALFLALVSSLLAKEQKFRFEKPDAQTVDLMSEFNQWKALSMTKQANGTWTVKVSIPPGTYGYKFLVDGKDWVFDPNNSQRKMVDGVENSSVEVRDDGNARPTAVASATATVPGSGIMFPGKPTPSPTVVRSDGKNQVTLSVTPGEVSNFEVPLSAKERAEAVRNGNPPVTTAKILLGVPNGFDPTRIYPVLVISATVNYPSSSLFPRYQREAMDAGWVIMAADGPEKPKDDHNGWRWAMISAGMTAIEGNWPVAKSWPLACGGFSGGAKRSGYMAGRFANTQHKVIGMLMGGCNEDMVTMSLHEDHPPFGAFVNIPIYLSSGTDDRIATPQAHKDVMRSMKASGFRNVRLETYAGAHDPYSPHTTEALNWFIAESTKGSPEQRGSDFDKFFKKKP
jgi:hypothetical protein